METQRPEHSTPRFSPEVTAILQRAGWYEGRALPESELEKWYAFKYYTSPNYHRNIPVALPVLREFGGLFVELDSPGVTCYRDSFWIDPLKTIGLHEAHWGQFEWLLEEALFPLGITGRSKDEALYITSSGKVFDAVYDGDQPILLVGNTFDEALNSLILGIMPQRVNFQDEERRWDEAYKMQTAVERLYPDIQNHSYP